MKIKNLVLGLILGTTALTVQSAGLSGAGAGSRRSATNTEVSETASSITNTVMTDVMNSNNSVVIECHLQTEGSLLGDRVPSLKETIKDSRCQYNKEAMEKLNNIHYEFGKVRGIFSVRGVTHVMIELIEG